MRSILGVVIGETSSPEEAERHAEIMKNCPYLVALGTTSNTICSIFIVPAEREWWLRYPETNPKETGLEKASVHIIKNVSYPESLAPRLCKKKTEIAPCGANCKICPLREQYNCNGCPSTIHHQEKTNGK